MRLVHTHIAAASFVREDEALAYSQEQWEREPGEDASNEVYDAWENRNPSWRMRDEIGDVYLDSDLIETVWNTGQSDRGTNWEYLTSVIGPENAATCKRVAPICTTTLILISENALGAFPFEFTSTPTMTYCGAFPSRS